MSEVVTPTPAPVQEIPVDDDSRADAEDWEGDEEYDNDAEADIDDEAEAEAEEIARRLGDQLWADISKAQAAASAHSTSITSAPVASKNEQAAMKTMKAILAFVENDPVAKSILKSTIVPGSQGQDVLTVFHHTLASETVSKVIAKPLSHVLVTLARSDVLFATLRNSNPLSTQLDKGKRKRTQVDETDEEGADADEERPLKKPYYPYDLQKDLSEAVSIITRAFETTSSAKGLDPSLISSIQPQLHQVFLFAVTLSAGSGPEMNGLKEISGLIQVISVVSGVHIGPPHATTEDYSNSGSCQQDIGMAVYPCQMTPCRKVFSRLYNLRAHQRLHAVHRPFHCTSCPASFARNHDLKRHVKMHDRKAWKCLGCEKIFSRRDAIKRHKNNSAIRGLKGEMCVKADILEVELNEQEAEDLIKEGRRAKLWTGIASKPANQGVGPSKEDIEEGEVNPMVIDHVQSAVMGLLGLLSTHVSSALGNGARTTTGDGNAVTLQPEADPAAGQATLASVIARVQSQNMPLNVPAEPAPAVQPRAIGNAQNTGELQTGTVPSLSLYGLSEEQTKMLEQAIASAASAAQAQAEAEAAMEEEDDEYEEDDDEYDAEEAGGDSVDDVS